MDEKDQIQQMLIQLEKLKNEVKRLEDHERIHKEASRGIEMEIHRKIDKEAERVTTHINRVEADLRAVLFGNGKLGLIIEIDRLKQFKKAFYWVTGVVVGILIKIIIDFISGK